MLGNFVPSCLRILLLYFFKWVLLIGNLSLCLVLILRLLLLCIDLLPNMAVRLVVVLMEELEHFRVLHTEECVDVVLIQEPILKCTHALWERYRLHQFRRLRQVDHRGFILV